MMTIAQIMEKMIAFSEGNIHDITHLSCVWTYAKTIGELEGLDADTQFILEVAAIGLNTNFKSLCRSGAKPMLHGFIISTLVVLVAIGVEYMIGIAPYGTL